MFEVVFPERMVSMKKVLSVVLAALLLFGTMSVIAFAADGGGYTPVYTVRVDSASEGKIRIIGLEDPNNTVPKGKPFYFTIEYLGDYRPDSTVAVKYYPASYLPDLVVTPEDTTEITTITPDANGVYMIPNVTEDCYVGVFNVTTSQFSSIKEMLLGFFNAIIAFFQRIFKR